MNDLISRWDAINAIRKEFDEVCVWDKSGLETANEVENILYEVPSAELEERTAKVVYHKYRTGTSLNIVGEPKICHEYLCGECKKKVLSGDDYCSHCGSRLDWGDIDHE